ncbi:hypothetical protein DL768_006400 [Monosporascus sp. mg162]|nr:hypothetical protein DL768_006400 [Monosporascus sp. mg162]
MGVFYEVMPKSIQNWILSQQVFWVATAPLSGDGHVNVSPKGGQYFGLVNERTFWYIDLSGSGNETISHLYEPGNGRITVMFNAFDGPPKIVRLWGKGRVLENGTPQFEEFVAKHCVNTLPGTRSIIIVDIRQAGSSCGFSVPIFDFKEHRRILTDTWAKREEKFKAGNEEEGMDRYWAYKNAWSVDQLPGMKRGLAAAETEKVEPIKKMVGPLAPKEYRKSPSSSIVEGRIVLVAILSFVAGVLFAIYGSELIGGLRVLNGPLDLRTARE